MNVNVVDFDARQDARERKLFGATSSELDAAVERFRSFNLSDDLNSARLGLAASILSDVQEMLSGDFGNFSNDEITRLINRSKYFIFKAQGVR